MNLDHRDIRPKPKQTHHVTWLNVVETIIDRRTQPSTAPSDSEKKEAPLTTAQPEPTASSQSPAVPPPSSPPREESLSKSPSAKVTASNSPSAGEVKESPSVPAVKTPCICEKPNDSPHVCKKPVTPSAPETVPPSKESATKSPSAKVPVSKSSSAEETVVNPPPAQAVKKSSVCEKPSSPSPPKSPPGEQSSKSPSAKVSASKSPSSQESAPPSKKSTTGSPSAKVQVPKTEDKTFHFIASAGGNVMNVKGCEDYSGKPETKIIAFPKKHPPAVNLNQLWHMEPIEKEWFVIVSALESNFVVEVEKACKNPGTPVIINTRKSPPPSHQQFCWNDNMLVSRLDQNMVLDVVAETGNVTLGPKYGGMNQRWIVDTDMN